MTIIAKCDSEDCVNNVEGECNLDTVTINSAWECDEYEEEDFTSEESEGGDLEEESSNELIPTEPAA